LGINECTENSQKTITVGRLQSGGSVAAASDKLVLNNLMSAGRRKAPNYTFQVYDIIVYTI